MICVILKIKDPLNYDVAFPENPEFVFDTSHSEKCKLIPISKSKYDICDEIVCSTYRVKIEGVVEKLGVDRESMSSIKHELIGWCNDTGSTFECFIKDKDTTYGRIIADMYNTREECSISTWLITNYPDVYQKYERRNSNIHNNTNK